MPSDITSVSDITSTSSDTLGSSDPRQSRYFGLIDRLLDCPNGEEPAILNGEPDLLDAGFVQALMQTASYFAHQDNADAAKFLVFIARELAHQLGLRSQT